MGVCTQSANPPLGLASIHLKERGDGSYEQYGECDEQLGREVAGKLPLCLHRAERSKGGRLAVHVFPVAYARPLCRLLLHRPLCWPGFHEGPTPLRYSEADDRLQSLPDPSQPVGFPEGVLLLADWSVQLALPARRLLQHRGGDAGGRHDLVVFLLKVHRLPRLLLLCPEKEMGTPLHPPCCSPRHHAIHCLVGYQVRWRWAHDFLRLPQHGGARRDVLLLPDECHGSLCAKVPLVEKVSHHYAAGPVCHLLCARLPSPLHRVRLPKDLQLRHPLPRGHVLPALRKLLSANIHQEVKDGQL